MSLARFIQRIRGTADLREHTGDNRVEIAVDDTGFIKYSQGSMTRTVVDASQTQTIDGTKTFSGTVTLSGTTVLSGAATMAGVVQQHADQAKVGATAGWVVNAGDNKNSLSRCPAEQTGSTLVVPLSLRVGDVLTGYYLVGQIESAGAAVTVDAALRKQTAAAADLADAAITDGAIVQVAVSADTILSSTTAGVTGLTTTVAADETYYVLITATTAASTDIDLQSVTVTKTAVV